MPPLAEEKSITPASSLRAALQDRQLRFTNYVLLGGVLTVGVVFALRHVEPLFSGASEVGDVVLAVVTSYIAGWVFYYLAAWRPRAVDRAHAAVPVARAAIIISNQARSFLGSMQRAHGLEESHGVDVQQVLALMPGLSLGLPAAIQDPAGNRGTLGDILTMCLRTTEGQIREIERWTALGVDAEMLRLCYDILDCYFFEFAVRRRWPGPAPLASYASELIEWFARSDRLKCWVCDHLANAVDAVGEGWDAAAMRADRVFVAG